MRRPRRAAAFRGFWLLPVLILAFALLALVLTLILIAVFFVIHPEEPPENIRGIWPRR